MIRYVSRISALAIRHSFGPALDLSQPDEATFRAWPQYCDQNIHLNNAHFLTFMDYGRIRWMARTRTLAPVIKHKIPLLVGGVTITYRREIRQLSTFQVRTEVPCWDDEWLYFAQDFITEDGKPAARGLVRAAIRTRDGRQPAEFLLEKAGLSAERPPMTEEIAAWAESLPPTLEAMRRG